MKIQLTPITLLFFILQHSMLALGKKTSNLRSRSSTHQNNEKETELSKNERNLEVENNNLVTPQAHIIHGTDDYLSVPPYGAIVIFQWRDLLENDITFGDGDSNMYDYIVGDISGPIHGFLWKAPNGNFIYYPPGNGWEGADTFTYELRYSDGDQYIVLDNPTVHIMVGSGSNGAVTVTDDEYTLSENTQLSVDVNEGLLANDFYDRNTGSMSVTRCYSNMASNVRGNLFPNSDGSFTYNPPNNYSGNVNYECALTYSDGTSYTSEITFIIEPNRFVLNAQDDAFIIQEDVPDTIDVLENDSYRPQDINFILDSHTNPSHGTLLDLGRGQFEYIPSPNFHGVDSFEYTLLQILPGNIRTESTASVTITVNGAPHAIDHTYQTRRNTNLNINFGSLIQNDFDPDFDDIQIDRCSSPSTQGGSVIQQSNSIRYSPRGNFIGEDSFDCTISDGAGGYSTGVVYIVVTST